MRTFIALTASALALCATPAIANPLNTNDFTVDVEHEDIDLTTRKGIARLDERIKTIIRQKCANSGRDMQSRRLERNCRASALASTQRQVRFAILESKASKVRLAAATPVAPEA